MNYLIEKKKREEIFKENELENEENKEIEAFLSTTRRDDENMEDILKAVGGEVKRSMSWEKHRTNSTNSSSLKDSNWLEPTSFKKKKLHSNIQHENSKAFIFIFKQFSH